MYCRWPDKNGENPRSASRNRHSDKAKRRQGGTRFVLRSLFSSTCAPTSFRRLGIHWLSWQK